MQFFITAFQAPHMPLEDGSCVRRATSPGEASQPFPHHLTALLDFLS